ncbi:MAG: hypothetical protein LQ350_001756 [Teloschistes chrysophthalmus]|nr:MAG: hypothetical protein LQ350_001756 [Niorma chrysophthalma]
MPARIANDPISRERVFLRSRLRSWGDLSRIGPQSALSPPQRTFNLQGLDHGCRKPEGFYYPIFRDFYKEDPFCSGGQLGRIQLPPIFEPIDMATVWKGLALSDCENLLSIQTITKDCLEHLLEHQVTQFQHRVLNERRREFNKSCATADCTNAFIFHRFLFDRSQLLVAVSKALDASTDLARGDNSRSMRELLMLYLWSRESLLSLSDDETSRSAIDVRLELSADYTGRSAAFSTLEAICIPHYLTFEKLDLVPQEGTDIVIKPHYRPDAPQAPGEPHMQVTYTLMSYHPWLHWDAEAKAFRGSLPYVSHQNCKVDNQRSRMQVYLLRIHIKALVVVSYPNTKIRLERTIGTRLNLRVVSTPRASSPPPPLFPNPFIIRRRRRLKVVSEASLKRQAQDQASETSWNSHHDEVKTDAELPQENPPNQSEQGTDIEKDSRENNIFATPKMIEVSDASRHTSSSLEQDTSQLSDTMAKSKRPKWWYTLPSQGVKQPKPKGWRSASTTSGNESRSETSSQREARVDEEAELFEMHYRLSTSRMRRAAKHPIVTTLPFRPRTVREQNPVTSIPLCGGSASAIGFPSDKSPKAIVSDAVIEKNVTKARNAVIEKTVTNARKRTKNKPKKKSSTRRRRAHRERLGAESVLIRDQSRSPIRLMKTVTNEESTEYPDSPTESDCSLHPDAPSDGGKCSVDSDVYRTEIDRCSGKHGKRSVPQQPDDCSGWNRRVPVVSWKDNQDFDWTRRSSGPDPEAFEVRMTPRASSSTDDSIVAAKVRAHTMPARRSNRTSDTAAGSSTLVQSSKHSSRKRKFSNANNQFDIRHWNVNKDPFIDPSSPSLMVEPAGVDHGLINPHPRLACFSDPHPRLVSFSGFSDLARGILRTPSPHDFFASRERSVVSELLRSPDARQAFAEPSLSRDERANIFEAMKRSLFDERTPRTPRGVDSVTEGLETDDALMSVSGDDVMSAWSERSVGNL